MTGPAASGGPAALDRLATALGPGFVTTLVTGAGRAPCLTVVDRATLAAEDVYADEAGWFWSPWADRIGATDDPLAAAHHLTAVLRGTPPAGLR